MNTLASSPNHVEAVTVFTVEVLDFIAAENCSRWVRVDHVPNFRREADAEEAAAFLRSQTYGGGHPQVRVVTRQILEVGNTCKIRFRVDSGLAVRLSQLYRERAIAAAPETSPPAEPQSRGCSETTGPTQQCRQEKEAPVSAGSLESESDTPADAIGPQNSEAAFQRLFAISASTWIRHKRRGLIRVFGRSKKFVKFSNPTEHDLNRRYFSEVTRQSTVTNVDGKPCRAPIGQHEQRAVNENRSDDRQRMTSSMR